MLKIMSSRPVSHCVFHLQTNALGLQPLDGNMSHVMQMIEHMEYMFQMLLIFELAQLNQSCFQFYINISFAIRKYRITYFLYLRLCLQEIRPEPVVQTRSSDGINDTCIQCLFYKHCGKSLEITVQTDLIASWYDPSQIEWLRELTTNGNKVSSKNVIRK